MSKLLRQIFLIHPLKKQQLRVALSNILPFEYSSYEQGLYMSTFSGMIVLSNVIHNRLHWRWWEQATIIGKSAGPAVIASAYSLYWLNFNSVVSLVSMLVE